MCNEAAVELWGRQPALGEDLWCGSWRIFWPDGTRRNVLPYPDPIVDAAGNVIGAVNMLVDITALRQTEQALRASERRQQQLMALMPAAVYTCDREGRITFYNRRAAELWNQAPLLKEDGWKFCAAHKCWLDGQLIPPDQTPMAKAVRSGNAFRNLEPVLERPDGSRFNALVNIDPLYDDQGELSGAINVFQDVTQLKAIEEQLRAREQHLRAIIDNTPECVKIVAADGTLLDSGLARGILFTALKPLAKVLQ